MAQDGLSEVKPGDVLEVSQPTYIVNIGKWINNNSSNEKYI